MTVDELHDTFERYSEEHLKFERIKTPRHVRPDICAFLMLHDLVPHDYSGFGGERSEGVGDIIAGTGHDEIWLSTSTSALAAVATEADVCDLVRCGVMWDSATDSLSMFV